MTVPHPDVGHRPASNGGGALARRFARAANRIAAATGNYKTFAAAVAVAVILVWAFTGLLFGFSNTWQLVINTGTTIVTFLMVFLIQNTQNRDALAVHLKLDELIRAMETADDAIMDAEDESDEELADLKRHYRKLADDQERIKGKLDAALRSDPEAGPPPASETGRDA